MKSLAATPTTWVRDVLHIQEHTIAVGLLGCCLRTQLMLCILWGKRDVMCVAHASNDLTRKMLSCRLRGRHSAMQANVA